MAARWEIWLERWLNAGLIDAPAAARIRAFETGQASRQRWRWPILLALAFGGVLLGAGVLLFVAAHWDKLSPAARFTTVLVLVGVFHIAAAFAATRWTNLASLLHGLGTVSLGAGIFLAGQIFHLQAHWPTGILLWAIGAWIGWSLWRDWVQASLAAVLTPAWLASEWIAAAERLAGADRILGEGLLLLAFVYFTARTFEKASATRRAMVWVGGLALLPCAFYVVLSTSFATRSEASLPTGFSVLGWSVGLGLPLGLAWMLRGVAAWMNALAGVWVVVLGTLSFRQGPAEAIVMYLWCALGSVGLVAWGLVEGRRERINLGIAGFAVTVLFFYFSSVIDKLGRSASLIGLGILFLGGGWLMERTRRRLLGRLEGTGV